MSSGDSRPASQAKAPGLQGGWLLMATLGIGSFMATMNNSIVNSILPVIRESFGEGLSTIEWVLMAYILVLSVFLLSFGRLGDMLGHKRVYVAGVVTFIAASGLCSLSPNVGFLIGARSLQAMAAAMLIGNAAPILIGSSPPERRGRVLGMLYTIASVGIIVGPPLGGYIASVLDWRAVFYINVLIGAVALALSMRILPEPANRPEREPFDLLGGVTMGAGLGTLLLAISKGQDTGWTSSFILGLVGTSVVLLTAFLWTERTVAHPMVDMKMFRDRTFSFAMLAAFMSYLCMYAGLFLAPFYMMQGRDFPPSLAGQLYSAQPLGVVIMAPIAGQLADRVGAWIPATLGTLGVAAGLYFLHTLGADSSTTDVALSMGLLGVGNGLFLGPNATTIFASAPASRQGVASGLVAAGRNLGTVFGTAMTGAILAAQIAERTSIMPDAQAAFLGAFQDTLFVMAMLAVVGASASVMSGLHRPAAPSR